MTRGEELAKARHEQTARLIRHRDECPQARVESFLASRSDGPPARVVRCLDCGRQSTENRDGVWVYE